MLHPSPPLAAGLSLHPACPPHNCSQGEQALGAIASQVEEMQEAEEEAARHAALVHARPWAERAAGGFAFRWMPLLMGAMLWPRPVCIVCQPRACM